MNPYAGIVLAKRQRNDSLLLSFKLNKNLFDFIIVKFIKKYIFVHGMHNI